jgi:hypothetical protein
MIRRSTWIVFAVFIVLALAAILLTRLPGAPLAQSDTATPSATPAPSLIEGWQDTDVTNIQLIKTEGAGQHYQRAADGSWIDVDKQVAIQTGKAEELLSEMLALRVLTAMPTDFQLDALGLTAPEQKIELARQDGSLVDLSVGALTPTGNGYYVRMNDEAPVVVSKYALEAVLQVFTDIQATPTPAIAEATSEATATMVPADTPTVAETASPTP